MRFASLAAPAALSVTMACAATSEPPGPPLTGDFGGPNIAVVATDTTVHYQYVCFTGTTGALRLQRNGGYSATGSSLPYSGPAFATWALHVTATVRQDGVVEFLIITTESDNGLRWDDTLQATRGATPSFPICPM